MNRREFQRMNPPYADAIGNDRQLDFCFQLRVLLFLMTYDVVVSLFKWQKHILIIELKRKHVSVY